MAEEPFDPRVAALFGENPEFGDEAGFAAAVERRLSRAGLFRILALGLAGALGVVLAAATGTGTLVVDAVRLLDGADRWMMLASQPTNFAWLAGGALLALYTAALVVGEV